MKQDLSLSPPALVIPPGAGTTPAEIGQLLGGKLAPSNFTSQDVFERLQKTMTEAYANKKNVGRNDK